jgi:hypothetical protein
MKIIHDDFSRFIMRVCNVQLLQNESAYIFAMIITYVGNKNDYKTVNVIQSIANILFPIANITIFHIQICLVTFIVIKSTKLTINFSKFKLPIKTDFRLLQIEAFHLLIQCYDLVII